MQTKLLTADETIAEGYAKFNRCNHLCVDLPDEQFTISARTPDGRRVTFGFNYYEDKTKGCVDISFHDSGRKNDNGIPLMDVSVRGQGPLYFASRPIEHQVTLVIVPMNRDSDTPNVTKGG